jgi:hypothetical protein
MDEKAIRFLMASVRYDEDNPGERRQSRSDCLVIRGYLISRDLAGGKGHPLGASATRHRDGIGDFQALVIDGTLL